MRNQILDIINSFPALAQDAKTSKAALGGLCGEYFKKYGLSDSPKKVVKMLEEEVAKLP